MAEKRFHPYYSIEDDDTTLMESDPVIKAAQQKRDAALFDISRQLQGIPYAGSGTKQELIELEQNMRELLAEKNMGYKYVEGFLLSLGYNLNKIRETFNKLTGMDPDVYMDAQPVLDTPGNIPGINYGWGKCKGKEYDHYFIMPYNSAWSVFGQKGDTQRDEVKHCLTLDDAREFLKKKVAELFIFDKVIDVKLKKTKDYQSLSDNLPLGTKTAELVQYLTRIAATMQPTELKAILENELAQSKISADEYQRIAQHFGLIRSAEPTDFEKVLFDKPLEDELEERTPQQFFDNAKGEGELPEIGVMTNEVSQYIDTVSKELAEFKLTVKSLKYSVQELAGNLEKTPQVANQHVEEFFNSTGLFSVLIDIADKTLPDQARSKPGLVIFTVTDNDLVTSGTFKGVDGKIYGLSEEGFEKYFSAERAKLQQ